MPKVNPFFALVARVQQRTFLKNQITGHKKDPPKYIKGVHRGNYFRIPVKKAPPSKVMPDIPKLPKTPQQTVPEPFKNAPAATKKLVANDLFKEESLYVRVVAWLRTNAAVMILNFGSICSLVGFTRSDVLELRCLNVTGSISSVIYFMKQAPLRWIPILWSVLFAAVNGWKIVEILTERGGTVVMDAFQEEIFVHFFMPHGITPKQFEVLFDCARLVKVGKGSVIIRQGEELKDVCLVCRGSTRASILGRHLSAASSAPERRTKEGGDSGAWIGEMAFLENLFAKEKGGGTAAALSETVGGGGGEETTKDANHKGGSTITTTTTTISHKQSRSRIVHSMYTIVAAEDSVLLKWKQEDMEAIMNRSTDFRAGMTRAMTAAIVGKVINFTVSRKSHALPTWSTWLDDWKHSAAARVTVQDENHEDEEDADEDEDAEEDVRKEDGDDRAAPGPQILG